MSTEQVNETHLSEQQAARLEALQSASNLSRTRGGPLGPTALPDVPELVDLAEYIIKGVHPMDRYADVKVVPDEPDA